MGGSRAAAPVARDVMTYLFDKAKAYEVLDGFEQQWGGTLAERTARQAAAIEAAARAASMAEASMPNGDDA